MSYLILLDVSNNNNSGIWVIITILLLIGLLWGFSKRQTPRTVIRPPEDQQQISPPVINKKRFFEELERQKPDTIQQITAKMDNQKADFLDKVENLVHTYIALQGVRCLTVVEKDANGVTLSSWELKSGIPYLNRLQALCRGLTFDGHQLAFGLVEPVIDIVTQQFQDVYQKQSKELSEVLCVQLLQKQALMTCVRETLLQSQALKYATEKVKENAVDLVIDQLQDATLGASPAALAIAANIANLFILHIPHFLTPVIMKALAVPVIEKPLLLFLEKYIAATFTAVASKAIALKLGISAATAAKAIAFFIVAPPLVALIYHDIKNFSNKLGRKISKKVRKQLDGTYSNNTKATAPRIVERFVDALKKASVDTLKEASLEGIIYYLVNSPDITIDQQLQQLSTKIGR